MRRMTNSSTVLFRHQQHAIYIPTEWSSLLEKNIFYECLSLRNKNFNFYFRKMDCVGVGF